MTRRRIGSLCLSEATWITLDTLDYSGYIRRAALRFRITVPSLFLKGQGVGIESAKGVKFEPPFPAHSPPRYPFPRSTVSASSRLCSSKRHYAGDSAPCVGRRQPVCAIIGRRAARPGPVNKGHRVNVYFDYPITHCRLSARKLHVYALQLLEVKFNIVDSK